MKKLINTLCSFLFAVVAFAQPGSTWTESGPINFPVNASGQINGLGRCTQLKFDPVNPYRMYATSASGGLWMSNDTGATWTNVGTDKFPHMQCASICIDYSNNNTLYLGSGDPNYYSSGYGVWKSTNAGNTWALSNTGMGNVLVVELIMDPLNNQRILAATDNGIYRTVNAGATWTLVKTGGDFKAMALKPFSADTVYAVTSSQIWRSVNFGTNWTQITSGVIVPGGGQGFRLAVSNAAPNVLYVGEIDDEGTILKSVDGGTTFSTGYHNPARSIVGYDSLTPGQGDYNFFMTCDPTNANVVYVAAHCVWKSTDGGNNFYQLTDWYDKCHTDMHGIRIHPQFTNMLFDVNDGGIFISRDGGISWTSRCDGIAATEIYHSAQSKLQRDIISIGTQDNGELYNSVNTWYTNRGGDWGSKCMFPYNSNNTVYYFQNGNRRPVNGSETSYNLPFTASDNQCMDFNRKIPNTGFAALTNVFKSTNLNAGTPTWTQVGTINHNIVALHSSLADSSVLFAVGDNNMIYRCDNVFASSPTYSSFATPGSTAVAACVTSIANNINVVYLTCGDKVYRSSNKGQTFTNISTGIPAGVNILGMYHDEYSSNEDVYVCTAKGVYYKNTSLSSWTNITYNLPSIADIQEFMFYNPGTAASVLRVGYYGRGVWDLPINTAQPPAPAFTADQFVVCPNTNITFTDLSVGNPTAWQWSFPGGTPSSSNLQNPVINYASPGVYAVTLTVTNGNGSNSLTQTAYINVTTASSLPITEGFAGTYLPVGWTAFDDGGDGVTWKQNLLVGGYSTSTNCTFFDNYNNDVSGKRDEIRTKTFTTSSVAHPVLTFDIAFARYDATYSDSLSALISTDCGQSFTQIYLKGGTGLATAPDNTNFFTPGATQWRTDTLDLLAYANMPELMVSFQNRGHYGNAIYIDNINLYNKTPNAITDLSVATELVIYPNPAQESVTISFSLSEMRNANLSITSAMGQLIMKKEIDPNGGNYAEKIDTGGLPKGMYFVTLSGAFKSITKKLLIQ